MITEDYVSFEVAKLLREKGFESDDCHTAYDNEGKFFWHGDYSKERKGIMDAPTHQMAMKWLRVEHNLCIAPYAAAYRYGFTIDKADTGSNLGNEKKFYPHKEFETYEEAVEAALKYTLENLI